MNNEDTVIIIWMLNIVSKVVIKSRGSIAYCGHTMWLCTFLGSLYQTNILLLLLQNVLCVLVVN